MYDFTAPPKRNLIQIDAKTKHRQCFLQTMFQQRKKI